MSFWHEGLRRSTATFLPIFPLHSQTSCRVVADSSGSFSMKTSHAVQNRQVHARFCRNPHFLSKTLLLVLASIYCTLMSAVETTGSVEGIVEDATHAVIPDVRITLVNVQTGDSRTLLTGPLVRFVFPSVRVGTYVLTAERPSFTKFTLSDLRVSGSRPTHSDPGLHNQQQFLLSWNTARVVR
jgi:hypothetical protein